MAEFSIIQPSHHDIYPFISPLANLKDAALSRTVLVTGGGSGIGVAIAKQFALAGACDLVLTGRRSVNLQNAAKDISAAIPSCRVHPIVSDVSDEKSVDKLFETIKSIGLAIDIVINNAGVASGLATVVTSEVEEWWKNFEIMVKGPYLVTRAFMRTQDHQKLGIVINTSSIGSNSRLPEQSAYGASKTAVNRLTEWTAAEGASQNIRAFAFHPGGVADTDITKHSPAWIREYFTETAELGAGTCVYLSTERSAFLSGRYVDAKWDMEELETMKERIVKEDLLKMSLLGSVRLVV